MNLIRCRPGFSSHARQLNNLQVGTPHPEFRPPFCPGLLIGVELLQKLNKVNTVCRTLDAIWSKVLAA